MRQFQISVTAETGVKLRKEASLISNPLTVLPYGTEVNVDRVGQEWVRVVTDGGLKGYVSADYLSVREGVRTTRSTGGSGNGSAVVAYGKQFIGTPYVWGGTNLRTGVDCSGFVYSVYKNFGISLNRNSAAMASNGVEVSKSNLQAGDLVFFNTGGDSKISHVGIYCGDGTYVHSTDGKARTHKSNHNEKGVSPADSPDDMRYRHACKRRRDVAEEVKKSRNSRNHLGNTAQE